MTEPTPAGARLGSQAGRGPARPSAVRGFLEHRGATAGGLVLGAIVIVALVGPQLMRYDPLLAVTSDQLRPPESAHPFGTDQYGRDVLTRVVHGASLSLQIGLIAVGVAVAIGILLGLPAGYFGSWTDMVVMRGVDVLLAFPPILLALSIVSVVGPSLQNAMLAVGISLVPVYVRLVRAAALAARDQAYVEAAQVVGCGAVGIMFRHILPNVVGPVVVVATLGVGGAIITGAALSFPGAGAQPPTPEWGAMLTGGTEFIRVAWWMSAFPGVAIVVTVLAINLVGDGLRDALDPRLHL